MFRIMKKDFFRIVLVPNLTFVGLALLVWFGASGEYDASMQLTTSAWIILFVFGGIIGVEQYESKFNGYRFLSTLPVTAKEIIGGKSLLAVVSLLIMGFGYYITFSPLIMEPGARNTLQNLVVVNSALVLFLVGLVYLAVAKVGFSRFYGPLWAVIILVGISPIIGLELFKKDVLSFLDLLTRTNMIPVIALTLVIYVGLILAAIKVKESQQ